MKKLTLLAFILLNSFLGNAQLTQVKNMTDNKLLPIGYEKGRTKIWKNKVFYQGQGISVPSPYHFRTCNLIVSDGTEAGTKLLKDIAKENYRDTYIVQWAGTDNYLYFTQKVAEGYYELWRTDGTTDGTLKVDSCLAGTTQLRSYISLGPNRDSYTQAGSETLNYPDNFENQPLSIGNKFYYTKYHPTDKVYYMYETTGTPESVTRIAGDYSYKYDIAMSFIVYDNKLYFRGAWYTVNQYSGVKNIDAKFFVYDGTSVSQTTVYADKFNGVFNGKLYYQRGAEIFSTTNLGANATSESTPTCSGSTFPGPNSKKNHFLMTDNFVILAGNFPCESDKYYLLNKNGQKFLLVLPPNNAVQEIFKDNNTAYFYSYEYNVTNVVNGTEIRAKTGRYFITKVNPDLTVSSVLSYRGSFHGTANNDILYYADLTEKQSSITPDGNNIELWRSNGTSNYMANDINTNVGYGYNWETQTTFDAKFGSNPVSFFTLNNVVYFIAGANDYKQYLYSLNPDFTFNNSTSNNQWNDSENWAAQIVPFEGDNIIIPAGQTPEISGDASVKDLNVNSPLNLSAGSLKVAGNLNLNSTVILNNNNLTLSGSSSQITNANSTNYVVTNGTGSVNVENVDAARGTVNLPIGTAANYSPVSIANTGTSDTFSARVSEGTTATDAVNATWEITESTAGGSDASITLGWNGGQEPSGFDRANAKVGHYTNGAWNTENSSAVTGTNSYSITATGITSFSPFAVLVPFASTKVNFTNNNSLSVYPNPVVDVLNVTPDENSSLQLYNASGKLVITKNLSKGVNTLSVKELQNGIYFYQLKKMDGSSTLSGKIIKK